MKTPGIVSAAWLKNVLDEPNIIVLDASWHLPDSGQNALADFRDAHIPGAVLFDISDVSDQQTDLPNMLPPQDQFERQVSAMGIDNNSHIIVYDTLGIFSAPRVWWMFRYFGHDKISVLDGGFPAWLALNLPTESGKGKPKKQGGFRASPRPQLLRDFDAMQSNLATKRELVVDLRSRDRFEGAMKEPWHGAGARGHIAGSKNLHYKNLLTAESKLKPLEQLQSEFQAVGVRKENAVALSCGSGMTACIGALALFVTGKEDVPVYDGSWAEWSVRYKPA